MVWPQAPPQTARASQVRSLASAAPGGPAFYSTTHRSPGTPKGDWWPSLFSLLPDTGPSQATELGVTPEALSLMASGAPVSARLVVGVLLES